MWWPFKGRVADAVSDPGPPEAHRWDSLDLPPSKPVAITMADALQNSLTGLGGTRDKRFYSDYSLTRPLTDYQLEARYLNSWMASSIIDVPVADMVREWVTRKWKDAKPEDQAALKRLETRLQTKEKVREALTWGGVFGGGAIIPMIRGQEDFKQPLDLAKIKTGDVLFLLVKDKSRVLPVGGDPDRIPGPNFGKPVFYDIVGDVTYRVHHTWVIRFEGRLVNENAFLRNNYWHNSELQHVDTALKDFDGAVENVAAMMWEAKVDVIKTSLAQMIAAKDGGASVQKRYLDAAMGKGNHRILLLNRDEEYASHAMAFGGVNDLLGTFIVVACAAARIPMVKLFGQSAPGMNSTGTVDEGLYYDRIAGEQESKMLPPLSRLDEIQLRDALGRMPEEYEIEANPLEQISPKDKAEIGAKNAERDEKYLKEGVVRPSLVLRNAKANGTYGDVTDEDLQAAEDYVEPAPVVPQAKGAPGAEDDPESATKGQPAEPAAS